MKLVNKVKLLLITALVACVCAVSMATTTTGGEYDLSTEIGQIVPATWDMITTNAGAIFVVAGFFIGLGIVLKLLRRMGAKPMR